jgi:hypothetical protein
MSSSIERASLSPAWRNRALSAAGVGLYLAAMLWLVPNPERRTTLHYLIVVAIGYGHLIGALGLSPRNSSRRGRIARPTFLQIEGRKLRRAAWLLTLMSLYLMLLERQPLVVFPLLAIATWHTAENDHRLVDTYDRAGRPGPLARSLDGQLLALATSALLMTLATSMTRSADLELVAEPGRLRELGLFAARSVAVLAALAVVLRERNERQTMAAVVLILAATLVPIEETHWQVLGTPVVFGDFFAATTLYHLASWLVLSLDRARSADALPGTFARLVAVHLPPIATCALLIALPGTHFGPLREAVFSPPIYLFWSVAHVVQTIVRRERLSRRLPAAWES